MMPLNCTERRDIVSNSTRILPRQKTKLLTSTRDSSDMLIRILLFSSRVEVPETKINKTARNVKMVQSTVITRRTLESGLAAGRGPPGLKEYAPSMVMNILFEE